VGDITATSGLLLSDFCIRKEQMTDELTFMRHLGPLSCFMFVSITVSRNDSSATVQLKLDHHCVLHNFNKLIVVGFGKKSK